LGAKSIITKTGRKRVFVCICIFVYLCVFVYLFIHAKKL
jgi:hypothetical protein